MAPRLPATLLLLAIGGFPACVVDVGEQGYSARVERRFEVTGVPEVHLVTFDGSVVVRAWDRDEVQVEVDKRGPTREAVEAIEVRADQTGPRVQVEARRPAGRVRGLGGGFQMPVSARIVAMVPRRSDVFVQTGDGSVRIERVEGRVELRTGDGSVRGRELSGRVVVETGDGSVGLEDVAGVVDVRTGDGGVTIAGRLEAVRVRTGDGSVTVRADPGSAMADDWELSTGDGSIVIYVPGDFGAELDARTEDGRVTTDADLMLTGGRLARGALSGRIGAGGRTLRLRTGDGTIHVRVS
jgi:hypothetical protein